MLREVPLRAAWALCALAAPGAAQVDVERVAVRVTAVDGARAWLDLGSDARLAAGDRVELFPEGQPTIEAVVRAVTRTSARIEWTGPTAPGVGTAGEALIPRTRPAAGAAAHPPWSQAQGPFDPSLPLLAPVRGVDNWDRERRLHGRWFASGDWSSSDSGDSGGAADYLLARSGLELELENPFGKGGALELDAEAFHRSSSLWDEGDEDETLGRVDRLSTWWGGVRGRETRYELGRFLQHEFPELGVLDGAEVTWRTPGGDRFGASAGFLPENDSTRSTGEDVAVSAYYRLVVGEDEHGSLGAGLQKTWHEGEPDRDLAVVTGRWRSGARWSLHGSAWIDFYGSEDTTKSSGAELTQAFASLTRRFDSELTLGLHASLFRWPELLRDELPPTTSSTLADGEVTRVGISASQPLTKRWRVHGRASGWSDQDDDGGSYELSTSLRDVLFERGEVFAGAFLTQGKFSDYQGARAGLARTFDAGFARLEYELAQAEQIGFAGAQSSLLQHTVRASFDLLLGRSWSLSLRGESRFGDEQDSLGVGAFLQRRF